MRFLYYFRIFLSLIALAVALPTTGWSAPFTPGNIVIARVGDGSAALTSAAIDVFLDEYTPAGVFVQTVLLPTAVSGNNLPLTAAGSSTSELQLTRSVDGHYLALTGYGTTPGTPTVATSVSTDVVRVIGLIGANGSINTTTTLGSAFSGASIRSAATVDGSSFYAAGGNSGLQYIALGGSMPTQINTAPTNLRVVNIFAGNLYVTSGSSPYIGLSQVSTGLPTTGPQTVTLLPGPVDGGTGASPYAFYFADLSPTVAGNDVVYVADDRITSAGGIQKWSLVGSTWVLNGTIAGSATSAIRGLNGSTTGTTVTLAATSSNALFFLSDNAGYNVAPSITALPTALVTAPSNTAFRGVAFAPTFATPTIVSFTPTSGQVGDVVTITGTNFTGTTSVTLNGVVITGFTVVNGTTITFTVPAGATSGPIAVTTPGGTATSTGTFTVITPNPAPTITGLTPNTAVAGSPNLSLTVTGTGYVSGSVVYFNGVALATTFGSATSLTATIPASALTTAGAYNVTVVNPAPGGGTSAPATFTVTTPAPTITSFTPTTGGPTTMVTITGTNFTGATVVRIGSFNVPGFMVVNSTTITFNVPTGTGSVNGLITVITPGGTAVSTGTFNLVSATLAAQALPGLVVFPNPAIDRVTVELPNSTAATVALRDLTGRVVLAPAPLAADHQLLLPVSLASGVYLLEVQQGNTTAIRRIEKR